MYQLNLTLVLPIAISFVSVVISYKAYKKAKEANDATQQWQKHDIHLRNKLMIEKQNKEYKEIATPYIDIMYNCYFETKELLTEFSVKA